MMIAGARMNSARSAKGGIQSSLVNIFTMSARGCSRPAGADPVGPEAVLKEAEQAALEPGEAGGDRQRPHEHDRNDHDVVEQVDQATATKAGARRRSWVTASGMAVRVLDLEFGRQCQERLAAKPDGQAGDALGQRGVDPHRQAETQLVAPAL